MAEALRPETKTPWWRSPIRLGQIATIVVLGGLVIFLIFFSKFTGKLTLNEVGDFFAGIAAPLAFIWIVVAVFLQRDELGAQRAQLEQQREELRLGREQLAAQAVELRSQSASLRRQEAILTSGELLQKWTARVHECLRKIADKMTRATYRFGSNSAQSFYSYTGRSHRNLIEGDHFEELAQFLTKQMAHHQRKGDTPWLSVPDLTAETEELTALVEAARTEELSIFAKPYELDRLLSEIEIMTRTQED